MIFFWTSTTDRPVVIAEQLSVSFKNVDLLKMIGAVLNPDFDNEIKMGPFTIRKLVWTESADEPRSRVLRIKNLISKRDLANFKLYTVYFHH
jgi:hypothetical protein